MKSFVVLAFFVAAASASVGIGGIGLAPVITNVKTIQPIATNVITPVVTPVVRGVVSRVITPGIVNTPVLRAIPIHTQLVSSRLISPIGLSGYTLSGYGLGGYGLGSLGLWKK